MSIFTDSTEKKYRIASLTSWILSGIIGLSEIVKTFIEEYPLGAYGLGKVLGNIVGAFLVWLIIFTLGRWITNIRLKHKVLS